MMRIRRSLLITPGHRGERLAKAAGLPVDGLVFDLEDGVPGARKQEARDTIADALARLDFDFRERIVRINPWGTEDCLRDLDALPLDKIDLLFVPKVESADDRLDGLHHLCIEWREDGVAHAVPTTRVALGLNAGQGSNLAQAEGVVFTVCRQGGPA